MDIPNHYWVVRDPLWFKRLDGVHTPCKRMIKWIDVAPLRPPIGTSIHDNKDDAVTEALHLLSVRRPALVVRVFGNEVYLILELKK